MDDDRDTRTLSRNVSRSRHVATEPHEHISAFQSLAAALNGIGKTRRQREERQRGATRQRNTRNLHQHKTGGGNQIRFQPRLRAQHNDLSSVLTQLRGRRQKRIHVTGGPAASHHNLDHKRLLNASG